ncbi:helix-turn-helix transcriptional regulator [Lactobacillaceae bacterium KNUT 0156]|nr:helix-turn-helix transcriptional regulator [Weissella cibaria]
MKLSIWINQQLKQQNKSVYWLAKETGIATSTLYAVMNGNNKALGLERLIKVAIALDADLNELKK